MRAGATDLGRSRRDSGRSRDSASDPAAPSLRVTLQVQPLGSQPQPLKVSWRRHLQELHSPKGKGYRGVSGSPTGSPRSRIPKSIPWKCVGLGHEEAEPDTDPVAMMKLMSEWRAGTISPEEFAQHFGTKDRWLAMQAAAAVPHGSKSGQRYHDFVTRSAARKGTLCGLDAILDPSQGRSGTSAMSSSFRGGQAAAEEQARPMYAEAVGVGPNRGPFPHAWHLTKLVHDHYAQLRPGDLSALRAVMTAAATDEGMYQDGAALGSAAARPASPRRPRRVPKAEYAAGPRRPRAGTAGPGSAAEVARQRMRRAARLVVLTGRHTRAAAGASLPGEAPPPGSWRQGRRRASTMPAEALAELAKIREARERAEAGGGGYSSPGAPQQPPGQGAAAAPRRGSSWRPDPIKPAGAGSAAGSRNPSRRGSVADEPAMDQSPMGAKSRMQMDRVMQTAAVRFEQARRIRLRTQGDGAQE